MNAMALARRALEADPLSLFYYMKCGLDLFLCCLANEAFGQARS